MEENYFQFFVQKQWHSSHIAVSKLVKIVMSLFFPVVVFAYILAYIFGGRFLQPFEFNILTNYISDLGSTKYTQFPLLFDLNAIITGILCLLVFYHSNNILHEIASVQLNTKNKWVLKMLNFGKYCLIFGPIGLAGIGIFSEDRNFYDLHFVFAIIAFLGYTFGSIAMAITSLTVDTFIPPKLSKLMIIAPLTLLILYLVNLILPSPFISMIFFEWCIFLCTFWWVLPNGFLFLRYLDRCKPNITPFSIQRLYAPFPTTVFYFFP